MSERTPEEMFLAAHFLACPPREGLLPYVPALRSFRFAIRLNKQSVQTRETNGGSKEVTILFGQTKKISTQLKKTMHVLSEVEGKQYNNKVI